MHLLARLGFVLPWFFVPQGWGRTPSPQDIIKKADEHRGLVGSHSVFVKLVVKNKDEEEISAYRVSLKNYDTSLVEQIEPKKNSDRKILMKGYDMWLFTATTKRPTRVSLEQKLNGDVANGDIARTQYAQDYEPSIKGEEIVNGKTHWLLELVAKNSKVTYAKIHLWVDQKTIYPTKALFFALSGKPLKQAIFSDFKKILGLHRSTKMTIYDATQKDKSSILIYSQHKLRTFPDSLFNKDHMEF